MNSSIWAGPISIFYSKVRNILSGNEQILEQKNKSVGIVNIRTRGHFGLNQEGIGGIRAITGFQRDSTPPLELREMLEGRIQNPDDESKYIGFTQISSRPISEVYQRGGHIGFVAADRYFSVKYDNRRIIDIRSILEDSLRCKLYFSKPHNNLETYVNFRYTHEGLKPKFRLNSHFYPSGDRVDYVEKFFRTLTRSLLQGALGCSKTSRSRAEILEIIEKVSSFRMSPESLRQNVSRQPIRRSVPRTKDTLALLDAMRHEMPECQTINELSFFSLKRF